jgi:SAM-dependent methyltransferase
MRRDSRIGLATRRALPAGVRGGVRRAYERLTARPPVGFVELGDLRRLTPIDPSGGAGRGRRIDAALAAPFIERHRDPGGRLLELGPGPPQVDDRRPFDCIVSCGQLRYADDPAQAIGGLYDALAHGGSLVLTAPGIAAREGSGGASDLWRFTTLSVRRLLEGAFPPECVSVQSFGNVLAATGVIYGLAAEDLPEAALRVHDPAYQVVIGARAAKA